MARILLIDDETNIRTMVRLALEQSGHEVGTASDGALGLEAFGDGSSYDIVLLDQRMPGMEGLDVLREMKARNAGTRIIMITAFGTIDLAVDAMKAGATDFLRKPFTTETLRGAVTAALATTPRAAAQAMPRVAPGVLEPGPTLYGLTTVNGYHMESDPNAGVQQGGDLIHAFSVRRPDGEVEECTVLVPAGTISDVKALAAAQAIPVDDRLWHALCEHVLADYLYQHAGLPPGRSVRVDEIDRGLRKWVNAALRTGF